MNEDLKSFMDKVMSLNPGRSTVFGTPASMFGEGQPSPNGFMASDQMIYQFQAAAVEFARLMANSTTEPSIIEAKAGELRGLILNLKVVSQISDELGNSLLEDLYNVLGGGKHV